MRSCRVLNRRSRAVVESPVVFSWSHGGIGHGRRLSGSQWELLTERIGLCWVAMLRISVRSRGEFNVIGIMFFVCQDMHINFYRA